jgi:hypothetical protein
MKIVKSLILSSSDEYHGRYCIITNPRAALELVLSLAVVVFVSWNGLRKPILPISVIELVLYVLVAAIFVKCLVIFRCVRERLILGLALTSLAIGGASGLVPVGIGAFADLIKYGKFGLWTFALLISISALISSARRPPVLGNEAVTVSPSRGLLVLSIVLVTALLLGALMYFIPLR